MRFSGQVAVVPGGASGIGAAAARRFHSEGAAVVIADLNAELGEALAAELGAERARFVATDVADEAAVKAMIDAAVAAFGRLDILFNNAGVGSRVHTPDLATEDWRRVLAINLDAVFFACRVAIPLMKAQGGGAIVNTASISGMAGDYGFDAYNAAKGAVINYTRSLGISHARDGVRVNAVCPGPVDTPIIAGIKEVPGLWERWSDAVPMGRFSRPEEIAAAVAFLASGDASYITGVALAVDGGLMAATGQPNLDLYLPKS